MGTAPIETRSLSLTTQVAAECLGVTRRMVRYYITSGELPAHSTRRLSRTFYRIQLEVLRDFAKRNGLPFNEAPLANISDKEAVFVN
jgi:excisionase family DNA binding protein